MANLSSNCQTFQLPDITPICEKWSERVVEQTCSGGQWFESSGGLQASVCRSALAGENADENG